MQSQQLRWQGLIRKQPISSKQQPGSLLRVRPLGVNAGVAALLLTALVLSLVLFYAAGCAVTTRNGYAALNLRREMEDLQAQNALLRYQINLAQSNRQIELAAARLGLRPSDPIKDVDYIVLPGSKRGEHLQLATADLTRTTSSITAALANLAGQMAGSAGGRAEASTASGHRR